MGSAFSMMTSSKDYEILEVIASQLEKKRKARFKKHQLFTQFFRALSFKKKRSVKFASGDGVDGVAIGTDNSLGELKRQVGAEPTSIPLLAGSCTSSGTGDVPVEQALLTGDVPVEQALLTGDVPVEQALFPGEISGDALFPNEAERSDPASASKFPTRLLLQVSISKLLLCLGEFLRRRCCLLRDLSGKEPVQWLHRVDRFLMQTGWQQQRFIVPGTVVFFYMLCRDIVSAEVATKEELQAVLLTCLYVSYSYEGHEISYPAKPFMVEENRETFWNRTLDIVNRMSGKMLQINNNPQYFGQVLNDLMKMKDH